MEASESNSTIEKKKSQRHSYSPRITSESSKSGQKGGKRNISPRHDKSMGNSIHAQTAGGDFVEKEELGSEEFENRSLIIDYVQICAKLLLF